MSLLSIKEGWKTGSSTSSKDTTSTSFSDKTSGLGGSSTSGTRTTSKSSSGSRRTSTSSTSTSSSSVPPSTPYTQDTKTVESFAQSLGTQVTSQRTGTYGSTPAVTKTTSPTPAPTTTKTTSKTITPPQTQDTKSVENFAKNLGSQTSQIGAKPSPIITPKRKTTTVNIYPQGTPAPEQPPIPKNLAINIGTKPLNEQIERAVSSSYTSSPYYKPPSTHWEGGHWQGGGFSPSGKAYRKNTGLDMIENMAADVENARTIGQGYIDFDPTVPVTINGQQVSGRDVLYTVKDFQPKFLYGHTTSEKGTTKTLSAQEYDVYLENIGKNILDSVKDYNPSEIRDFVSQGRSEWHPKTKVLVTKDGFTIDFPYAGAEKYTSHLKTCEESKSNPLTAISLGTSYKNIANIPLASAMFGHQDQKKKDIIVQTMHDLSSRYGPSGEMTWGGFAKSWVESPYTAIGMTYVATVGLGAGFSYLAGIGTQITPSLTAMATTGIGITGTELALQQAYHGPVKSFEKGDIGQGLGESWLLGTQVTVGIYGFSQGSKIITKTGQTPFERGYNLDIPSLKTKIISNLPKIPGINQFQNYHIYHTKNILNNFMAKNADIRLGNKVMSQFNLRGSQYRPTWDYPNYKMSKWFTESHGNMPGYRLYGQTPSNYAQYGTRYFGNPEYMTTANRLPSWSSIETSAWTSSYIPTGYETFLSDKYGGAAIRNFIGAQNKGILSDYFKGNKNISIEASIKPVKSMSGLPSDYSPPSDMKLTMSQSTDASISYGAYRTNTVKNINYVLNKQGILVPEGSYPTNWRTFGRSGYRYDTETGKWMGYLRTGGSGKTGGSMIAGEYQPAFDPVSEFPSMKVSSDWLRYAGFDTTTLGKPLRFDFSKTTTPSHFTDTTSPNTAITKAITTGKSTGGLRGLKTESPVTTSYYSPLEYYSPTDYYAVERFYPKLYRQTVTYYPKKTYSTGYMGSVPKWTELLVESEKGVNMDVHPHWTGAAPSLRKTWKPENIQIDNIVKITASGEGISQPSNKREGWKPVFFNKVQHNLGKRMESLTPNILKNFTRTNIDQFNKNMKGTMSIPSQKFATASLFKTTNIQEYAQIQKQISIQKLITAPKTIIVTPNKNIGDPWSDFIPNTTKTTSFTHYPKIGFPRLGLYGRGTMGWGFGEKKPRYLFRMFKLPSLKEVFKGVKL